MKKWILRIFSNFGIVSEGRIYRSGQGWMMLLFIIPFLRLDTIINLSYKPLADKQDRFEKWLCKIFKIEYITFTTIAPNTDDFQIAYLRLVENWSHGKKVLVHCEGGKDRTGGLIAYFKLKYWNAPWCDILDDFYFYGIPDEGWLDFIFI